MQGLIQVVLEQGQCLSDKVRVLTLSIYAMGTQGKVQEAIDLGFDVLQDLGDSFPKLLGKVQLYWEFTMTRPLLRELSDEDILRLPTKVNKCILAAMRVIIILFPYVLTARHMFAPALAMRMICLTTVYGVSGMSSCLFAMMGLIMCNTALGEIDLGLRWPDSV